MGQILRETAKILPKTAIWLGGPEVSYNAREVLENYPMVQGIMKGEGEESFTELVAYYGKLKERKQLRDIEGLMFRDENGEIIETENRPILDLSTVPLYMNISKIFRTGSFTMSPAEDVHFPAVTVFLP